jgi:hypothetical protein
MTLKQAMLNIGSDLPEWIQWAGWMCAWLGIIFMGIFVIRILGERIIFMM